LHHAKISIISKTQKDIPGKKMKTPLRVQKRQSSHSNYAGSLPKVDIPGDREASN